MRPRPGRCWTERARGGRARAGLAIGTGYWRLGVTVGVATAAVLFVTDLFRTREQRQAEPLPPSARGP